LPFKANASEPPIRPRPMMAILDLERIKSSPSGMLHLYRIWYSKRTIHDLRNLTDLLYHLGEFFGS